MIEQKYLLKFCQEFKWNTRYHQMNYSYFEGWSLFYFLKEVPWETIVTSAKRHSIHQWNGLAFQTIEVPRCSPEWMLHLSTEKVNNDMT